MTTGAEDPLDELCGLLAEPNCLFTRSNLWYPRFSSNLPYTDFIYSWNKN